MRPTLSKRTIQLAGIVTILAMSGGFALASINAPGTTTNTVVSNGQTNTNFVSTAWTTGVPQVGTTSQGAVCVNGLSNGGSCTPGADQSENFMETQAAISQCPGSPSDTFTVVSVVTADSPGGHVGTFTSTYVDTTCVAGGQSFLLAVDFGANTEIVSVSSISVQVSGNF